MSDTNLLKYRDIQGHAGVWHMHSPSGRMQSDFLVQDGRGGCWHANAEGYCCANKHTDYKYSKSSLDWRKFAKGHVRSKSTTDRRLLLI
jgi:hypothetical protein